MKATGIVRRLDDLGRLVIPKEIRKQYRLKEGDSIEFFIDNDNIIIRKFDVMSKHLEEIDIMCDTLHAMYQNKVLFIQDEWIDRQKFKIKETFVKQATIHRNKVFENQEIYVDDKQTYSGIIYPITAFGDWFGSFVVLYDKKILENEECYALEAFVQLLSRQQQQ
ncbi:MAG: AbrB/MazE/SpoVT family DNA-binding domain-containing protein [Longicatena sp.]